MAAAMPGPAASDIRAVPGWYGKLPSLGDFASRRLDPDFIEPWDLWLGERLQGLRDTRGEAWLDPYLHSPPWRFLLMRGVLGGAARTGVLAGVLLSSVDRVGRYFPLTVVAALPRVPTSMQEVDVLLAWMQRLEDIALDALQLEWDIAAFENALAGLGTPAGRAADSTHDPLATARRHLASALEAGAGAVDLAPAASRQDLAAVIAGAMDPATSFAMPAGPASPLRPGTGLWLSQRPERQRLLVTHGLPAPHEFFQMFGAGSDGHDVPAAPMPTRVPDDTDLLGMFDSAPAAPDVSAARGSDGLGLLTATPVAASETPEGDETRPGDHDILALFDAQADSGSESSGDATKPSAPDILDLFGAKPDDDGKTI